MSSQAAPPPRGGKLRSVGLAAELMRRHYLELAEASATGSRKIAWCSSVGPAELLRAMGFLVYFPENHAAMLGAARKASDVMTSAGRLGYSSDICSYLRSDIGACLDGVTALSAISSTIAGPPSPDVLVYNTNQCRDVKNWFTWYAARLGVPCIGIEGYRAVDIVTDDHVKSVSAQLKALVPILEGISEASLDAATLSRVVGLSGECSQGWADALGSAAQAPSPLSFFNALLLMGPAVVARGTREAVEFHRRLNDELDFRKAEGKAAVKNERLRLYWEGMPVWGRISALSRLFSDLNACVVASTYCHSWVFEALDPSDPFDSMARAYTELFIVRSEEAKEAYIENMIERFSVDGVIFLDAKTCPANTNNRYGMPERLQRRLGVPCTTIYSDHMDLSLYDADRVETQIEAFMEQLEGRMTRGRATVRGD